MNECWDDAGDEPGAGQRANHEYEEDGLGRLRNGVADGFADGLPLYAADHADAACDERRQEHGDLVGPV